MDWLAARQDAIEAELARRHLAPDANPARMALFDLSSSWLEGSHCPLAARGYSRDGKKGKPADRVRAARRPRRPPGRGPGAPRRTPATPPRSPQIVQVVRDKFGLEQMVMVGDRGMITNARIRALNPPEDGTAAAGPLRVDHRAARPGDQEADGRRRPAAAQPLRRAGPGRDHQPGLPRRAAGRLPQPGAGRRPGAQARGPAGRHREAAGPHHRPRRRPGGWPAPGRSGSRSAR